MKLSEDSAKRRALLKSAFASLAAAMGIVAALAGASPLRADDYPSRPIHILVPYAPGGIADIAARLVGAKLTEAWGQQVVVENKPGGNGFIAMADAARATPDGYTLVMRRAATCRSIRPCSRTCPTTSDHDLAPITAVSDAPLVLATNAKSPYMSVADVLAAARAQPGQLNVCTPGYGSINQIVLEWMALESGTKFVHVPYKGGAPAAQALVAGDIPLGVLATSSVAPHVKAGSVRVLAVTMDYRSPLNPEWPTLQESGVKDVNASNWTALLGAKAIPQPILDKLNAEVAKILNMPDVKERFAAGGVVTIPSTAAELDARIKREFVGYRGIIAKANIKPE